MPVVDNIETEVEEYKDCNVSNTPEIGDVHVPDEENTETILNKNKHDEEDDDNNHNGGDNDDDTDTDTDDDGKNTETVFTVDVNGDHVEHTENCETINTTPKELNDDYGIDFNEYVDHSDTENVDEEVCEDVVDDDDEVEDDEYDEYDDESEAYDDENLVVPDVGITREPSMASRITNESGIFSNPRQPSIAFQPPTLQTLSEEMKGTVESDSDFINSTMFGNSTNNSTRTLTMTTSKIINNHSQFVSNARYSESIMSYDTDNDNDDAFSFQVNDDKEYEIGYVPTNHDNNNDNSDDDNLTDTNLTDTESIGTPNVEIFAEKSLSDQLPPIPVNEGISSPNSSFAKNRDSIFNAHELENEVDAMRNVFVRSDMHPSVLSKSTAITDFDTSQENIKNDKNANIVNHSDTDLSDINSTGSTKKINGKSTSSTIDRSSCLSQSTDSTITTTSSDQLNNNGNINNVNNIQKDLKIIEKFEQIPDVDLLQLFINNPKPEQNIETLKDIRNELNNVDTGITEWISYNMGDSMKINMDDDKLGIHVREAFRLLDEGEISSINIRNTFSISDTMETVAHGLNVSKLKDAVKDVKVKKIGQRGKTLLRKLKKVP
jgi:hypothetical protein